MTIPGQETNNYELSIQAVKDKNTAERTLGLISLTAKQLETLPELVGRLEEYSEILPGRTTDLAELAVQLQVAVDNLGTVFSGLPSAIAD